MRDASLARAIVESLGVRVDGLREIVGEGEVNHAFDVDTSEGRWVVRFPRDPLDTGGFAKEKWCLKAASRVGVPTPEWVAMGQSDGVPWIVQRFVVGEHHAPWRTLGEYARRLAETPLDAAPNALFPRFGRDLVRNWTLHLDYNEACLGPEDPLHRWGVYDAAAPLRDAFARLRDLDRFGLFHGDLAPDNVIVADGVPILIDWGSAATGPVPHSELLNVRSRFPEADARAFAEGAGFDFDAALPTLRDLRLLNAVDVVRWAIDSRPDRIEHYVERAKTTVKATIP